MGLKQSSFVFSRVIFWLCFFGALREQFCHIFCNIGCFKAIQRIFSWHCSRFAVGFKIGNSLFESESHSYLPVTRCQTQYLEWDEVCKFCVSSMKEAARSLSLPFVLQQAICYLNTFSRERPFIIKGHSGLFFQPAASTKQDGQSLDGLARCPTLLCPGLVPYKCSLW